MALRIPKGYFMPPVGRRKLVLSPNSSGYIGIDGATGNKKWAIQIEKITTGYPNPKATYRGRLNHMENWEDFDKLQTLITVMCAKHRVLKQ